MKFKVAVVQFAIRQFAPQENLRYIEYLIQKAASEAQIIVFPEDAVTGPLCENQALADREGRYLRHFQQLAARYAIDIVPGSIIEEDCDGLLYNTTYYIDSKGVVRGRYRKINLWLPERAYLTPGHEAAVFETDYGRVGLLICWDLIFPEVFRAMVRQGVQMVICPSYWCFEDAGVGLVHDPLSEVKLVNALCIARAFENEIVLVYANAAAVAGREGETLIGRSQITVPFKGVLAILDHAQEDMFVQEVDTAILADAETAYEIRKDLLERRGFLSTGR